MIALVAAGALAQSVPDAGRLASDAHPSRLEQSAPQHSGALYADLKRPAVGTAAGRGEVWAVAVVPAPVEAVWMALNSPDELAGAWGSLVRSDVLEGDPRRSGRVIVQVADLPLVRDRYWVVEQVHGRSAWEASGGAVWEIAWRAADRGVEVDAELVPGTRGGWLLVPVDEDRTLVEYFARSDSGGGVAGAVATSLAARAARGLLEDLTALARSKQGGPTAGYVTPAGEPLEVPWD